MKAIVALIVILAVATTLVAAIDRELHNRIFGDIAALVGSGRSASELATTVLAPNAPGFNDVCSADHGEFRRQYDCVSVMHTKDDGCCALRGLLPYACCGVGWSTSRCGELVNAICAVHHADDL